ncbi:pyruvate kinase [Roseivirga sp. BDSF3-8]|uniref:pyruvate kinase n=1 Tax=Roseivirga sp. BDSF3-8 TaxID=3241598 RepID=UPI0035322EB7
MNKEQIKTLLTRIEEIVETALRMEEKYTNEIEAAAGEQRVSLRNFLHYLALGHHNIRDIQDQLSSAGISSLKNAQLHTLENLHAAQQILHALLHTSCKPRGQEPITLSQASEKLKQNTEALLGQADKDRHTRIMVTFSSSMAHDYQEVKALMQAGMNVARINCAKDDEEAWDKMIRNIKKAEKETGRPCQILMDLAGPKIRTGEIKPGPRQIKIKVTRDIYGKAHFPLTVAVIFDKQGEETDADIVIPVRAQELPPLKPGDHICFRDARDSNRTLQVAEVLDNGFLATTSKNAYLETGMTLRFERITNGQKDIVAQHPVAPVPQKEQYIYLQKGDKLILHARQEPGEPPLYDNQGKVTRCAHIAISLPEVIRHVQQGHKVLFDDGKIEAIVAAKRQDELELHITYAKNERRHLKADKGINFPESDLDTKGLTEKDLKDLDFVAKHAHVVNLSFVQSKDDVLLLQEELKKRNASQIGVMLKIETTEAVHQLPWILMAAMRTYPIGVMIARGDLAVEIGWVELARYQEEIQWMCRAAHIPDVWATQVLEGMAKKGLPKRSEVTDAARSQRAACVMLNKGDYIIDAIRILDNILRQVEDLQYRSSHLLQDLPL